MLKSAARTPGFWTAADTINARVTIYDASGEEVGRVFSEHAALAVAAPDLLAALRRARSTIAVERAVLDYLAERPDKLAYYDEVLAQADAAIAKATEASA